MLVSLITPTIVDFLQKMKISSAGFQMQVLRIIFIFAFIQCGIQRQSNDKESYTKLYQNISLHVMTQIPNDSKNIMNCPCCGGVMEKTRDLETSVLMKCKECGLSDTILK
jgi:RNase P subunit RPR2